MEVTRGPSGLRLRWTKMMCAIHFTPKVKIVVVHPIHKHKKILTYRVYRRYFTDSGYFGGRNEHFWGILMKIESPDGDIHHEGWRSCCRGLDKVTISPATRTGDVEFHPSNDV